MVESTTKKLDQYKDSDKEEIVNQHPNVRGDMTVVFENKDTGERKTFPNVNPDNLEGGGQDLSGGENIDRGGGGSGGGGGGGSGKQGFASMPKEEVREIASKGGKASGEARRAKSDNIL